ncbi:sulfurtransferase 18 [Striga asiatica]|uniref:Sulfurtransferase 18 n=1 Tax=Striga asiatica TaxID=4170 RepID=A0A5A7RHQ4_STRAF|nr:sulfurtransferase 18 [Striga asiatica]
MRGCLTKFAMIHCRAVDVVSVPAFRNSPQSPTISSSSNLLLSSSGSCKSASVSTRDLMSGINTLSWSWRIWISSFHRPRKKIFPSRGHMLRTLNLRNPKRRRGEDPAAGGGVEPDAGGVEDFVAEVAAE